MKTDNPFNRISKTYKDHTEFPVPSDIVLKVKPPSSFDPNQMNKEQIPYLTHIIVTVPYSNLPELNLSSVKTAMVWISGIKENFSMNTL
jgi:hypothetical protein